MNSTLISTLIPLREPTMVIGDLMLLSSKENRRNNIYEVFSLKQNKKYILKSFPLVEDSLNPFYCNESRFFQLMHPNIVKTYEVCDSIEFKAKKFSYIMTEFIDFKMSDFLKKGGLMDEKLLRSIMHQLVSGVSFLHDREICHMDLKVDNIMISSAFEPKIIDFDLAYKQTDVILLGTGTNGFRAPELKAGKCVNGKAADIYSLAIVIFCILFGHLPYSEEYLTKGYDLKRLLWENPEEFWDAHIRLDRRKVNISSEFKTLFNSMTRRDPSDRTTIDEIKKSQWFMKSLYPLKEYNMKMSELIHE